MLPLLSTLELLLSQEFSVLLEMCFDGVELLQQIVVFQNFDVLDVEVGLVASLELLLRLTSVHSFQDAQSSEVLERQLKSSDGVAPSKVL